MKMAFKAAPLPSSFLLAGMIGFIVSVMYIIPSVSASFGIAFALVFLCMVIASLWSMSTTDVPDDALVPEFREALVPVGSSRRSQKSRRRKKK